MGASKKIKKKIIIKSNFCVQKSKLNSILKAHLKKKKRFSVLVKIFLYKKF